MLLGRPLPWLVSGLWQQDIDLDARMVTLQSVIAAATPQQVRGWTCRALEIADASVRSAWSEATARIKRPADTCDRVG